MHVRHFFLFQTFKQLRQVWLDLLLSLALWMAEVFRLLEWTDLCLVKSFFKFLVLVNYDLILIDLFAAGKGNYRIFTFSLIVIIVVIFLVSWICELKITDSGHWIKCKFAHHQLFWRLK